VSLWWREQLRVSLAPGRVAVRRRTRGPRRRELDGADAAVAPAAGAPTAWQAALQTFEAMVVKAGWHNAELEIVLSNHFVHYLALPWVENLAAAEFETFARHQLQSVYGTDAAGWAVCSGRADAGQPRIAAATDAALIDELRALAKRRHLHLCGVEPLLAAECATLPAADSAGGWLALVEPGRISVSRLERGHCLSVRAAAFSGPAERTLLSLLEQDALCAGVDAVAASKLFLRAGVTIDSAALRERGWQVLPSSLQAMA
jgi:hypothetical protein